MPDPIQCSLENNLQVLWRSIIIVFVIDWQFGLLGIPWCSQETCAFLAWFLDPLEVLRHVQAGRHAWWVNVLLVKEACPRCIVLHITSIRIDCCRRQSSDCLVPNVICTQVLRIGDVVRMLVRFGVGLNVHLTLVPWLVMMMIWDLLVVERWCRHFIKIG